MDAVRFLKLRLIKQNLDALVFFWVVQSISYVALDTSKHLLEFPTDALLPLLNYSCDVAVASSVLLAKFITVATPQFLVDSMDKLSFRIPAKTA